MTKTVGFLRFTRGRWSHDQGLNIAGLQRGLEGRTGGFSRKHGPIVSIQAALNANVGTEVRI